jgi:hypothetical protein
VACGDEVGGGVPDLEDGGEEDKQAHGMRRGRRLRRAGAPPSGTSSVMLQAEASSSRNLRPPLPWRVSEDEKARWAGKEEEDILCP